MQMYHYWPGGAPSSFTCSTSHYKIYWEGKNTPSANYTWGLSNLVHHRGQICKSCCPLGSPTTIIRNQASSLSWASKWTHSSVQTEELQRTIWDVIQPLVLHRRAHLCPASESLITSLKLPAVDQFPVSVFKIQIIYCSWTDLGQI